MNSIRRLFTLLCVALLLTAIGAGAASAADSGEVVDDLSTQSFYLEPGVSISSSDATQIVSTARNSGSRFYLVVLADTPLGGSTSFAEAAFDELAVPTGTVVVITPEDVGWVTEDDGFADVDLEAAYVNANAAGGNDAEYAANFVIALLGGDVSSGDTATQTTAESAAATSGSSGGGGNGFIWFIVIIAAVLLLLFWLVRRGSKQTENAAAEQLAKARLAIQKQVDAIANDILDMEDEVRVADNAEVHTLYNEASETYRTLTERLQAADNPQELLAISNELDLAIWKLDCAEAVLDGKPKPARPEPKRLEPEPSRDRVTVPPPRPDYQRRPSRRSSYLGPGMLEILIGVAGQVLAGGSRGSRSASGGLGSIFGRSTARRSQPPSASGGGGIIPGPGSRVRRRSSTRSTRSSSRRRSGGGRIRGGGRRRR
jgi:hypothetical protein